MSHEENLGDDSKKLCLVEKESVILVEPWNGQTKIEADAKMGNTDVQHR
jgi:hypothetical protein